TCTGTALPRWIRPQRVFGIGITTLDHKTGNNSVEDRPIVKAGLGQLDKVFNMIRGHIRIQLDMYVSELSLDNGFRTRDWRRSNRFHVGLPSTTRKETDRQHHSAQQEASHGSRCTPNSY